MTQENIGSVSKGFIDIFEASNMREHKDRNKILSRNSSYMMNLDGAFESGADEVVEIIDVKSLNKWDLPYVLREIRKELHRSGYKTTLTYFLPEGAKTTTCFSGKDNLYELKIRKRRSFFDRLFND